MILPAGIGSYVTVLEPKADEKGKLKYSITILVDKARSKELDAMRTAALEVAEKKWPGKGKAILANAKYPVIKDGDKKMLKDSEVPDPVYAGKWYFQAKTDRKPMVIDANKQPVTTDDDIYSGCLVRISANPYAYEYQGNKGVSLGLNNVQVLRKGDRIDGRMAAEAEFSEWVDTEAVADPLA